MLGDAKLNKKGLGDVTDLKTGRDLNYVKIMTSGSGGMQFPNYDQSEFLDPSPAGTKEQIERWKENMFNLAELRNSQLKTYEELEQELKIYDGEIEDPSLSFNFNKKETVVNTSSKPKTKPSTANDDGDEALVEDDYLSQLRSM